MAITGYTLFFILALSLISSSTRSEKTDRKEFVLTLDHTNFTETINKHHFIVVNFYTSWCKNCKQLADEYEEVASELSSHVPPVVLAKIDASEEINRKFATHNGIVYYPSIKIFKYGGKIIINYRSLPGPYNAVVMFVHLKKEREKPIPSLEIKSADDAAEVLGDKKVVVVGIFPTLSGLEFNAFLATAEKMNFDAQNNSHSSYTFAHTLDAKLLPRGNSSVTGPVVRLFKPFDELFVDSKEFDGKTLEKFVIGSSIPLVTVFDKDPNNHPFVARFLNNTYTKVMLYINFHGEAAESFKSKFREVATSNKRYGLRFLIGNAEDTKDTLLFYGLEENQVPLIIICTIYGKKYLKANVEVGQIESSINDFRHGRLPLYKKSQPIPTVNNEPVKVVVSKSFDEMVFNSRKNVLLKFYDPECEHCQNFVLVLEEVALSYQSDPSVVIAKLDTTTNDFPHDTFNVKEVPVIYFRSSRGKIVVYKGDIRKEDIINFIDMNKDTAAEPKKEKATKKAKDEL